MKVGDKVWIPVKVAKFDDDETTKVEYDDIAVDDFWVYNTEIQTVTAEDYRNALNEFYKIGVMERVKIWGFGFIGSALDITAEEFVDKLRKYQSEPKVGQIWKSPTGKKIVIFKVDKGEVHYFTPSGYPTWSAIDYFKNNFCNTGEVLISIDAFLKDLGGLNEG